MPGASRPRRHPPRRDLNPQPSPPPSARASPAAAPSVPKPVIAIDNTSDSFATVVRISYGDRLGELLDTTAALRNLGLNIRRAKLGTACGENKFYITDARTSEKVRRRTGGGGGGRRRRRRAALTAPPHPHPARSSSRSGSRRSG